MCVTLEDKSAYSTFTRQTDFGYSRSAFDGDDRLPGEMLTEGPYSVVGIQQVSVRNKTSTANGAESSAPVPDVRQVAAVVDRTYAKVNKKNGQSPKSPATAATLDHGLESNTNGGSVNCLYAQVHKNKSDVTRASDEGRKHTVAADTETQVDELEKKCSDKRNDLAQCMYAQVNKESRQKGKLQQAKGPLNTATDTENKANIAVYAEVKKKKIV